MGPLDAVTVLKLVGALVGVVVLAVGGAWAAGIVGTPAVDGVNNAFGDVNESTTVIRSELLVSNPNPIEVQLGGLTADYAIEMNGIRMAEGHKEGLDVAGRGTTAVPLRTEMNNSKLPAWWVSHVRNGERTTLTVDASVRSSLLGRTFSPQVEREINTSIIAAFNTDEDRPIDANKPLVSDPVLWLNRTAGEWGTVDEETTEIEMAFDLHNPKSVPITITEIGYDIRMNDVTMGEGTTDKAVSIPPGATRTVRATTLLNNHHLDEWWVTHLRNDQTTTLEVEFYARVDLSAAGGGTVRIPLDTMERPIETDMFGNKGTESGDGGETETTPTDTDANGGSAGDGTATGEASTKTPTASPAPTPTPTDDGISLDRRAAGFETVTK